MQKSTAHGSKNDECKEHEFDFNNALYKHNIDSRRVSLWEDVDDDSALSLITQLNYLAGKSKDPILLVINSSGGSIVAMTSIIDEIEGLQNHGVIVNTLVNGSAYSAAACILTAGSKGHRYARPYSTVMMHPMSYGLGYDYAQYQEKATAFWNKIDNIQQRRTAAQMGIKGEKRYQQFLKEIDKGLWLTAEEALARNIVDKIWTKPLSELPGFKKGK